MFIILYHNEDNKCLNITCLVPKKNESSNLTETITIDIKNIVILYFEYYKKLS